MAYFPFFFELKNKIGVIIGGGSIALEKVERLSSFNANILLIAPVILDEIKAYDCVNYVERDFLAQDLENADYVIAATDKEYINREICDYCRARKIPVNVVDDQEKCDFIFPSVIQRGPLVIGVTSSGASPQVAVNLRKQFEEEIPDNIEEILDYLSSIRPLIKEKITDSKERHRVLKKAGSQCMALGRPLSDKELEEII